MKRHGASLFFAQSLAFVLILAVGLSGCSFPVHVVPNPPIMIKEKIQLDVGLHLDPAQARKIHSQSGFCLIGMAHTWNIETGQALKLGAKRTFEKVFASVEELESAEDFAGKPLALLITPQITTFNVSQSMVAELSLYCKLVDKAGKTIYENTIPANGESQMMNACILGVFGGEGALSKTSESAFNNAFVFLANDIIKTVDFAPYLSKVS